MSDTPRTDAWFGVTAAYQPASDDESGMNLCRQLERELAAAKEENAVLHRALEAFED